MKSTQAIRQMNLSSALIDSEHLSELAEPVAIQTHPATPYDVELPEIVVTFRDVTSSLDEILTAHEDGIPEYVSYGDPIAASELETVETTVRGMADNSREAFEADLDGKVETRFGSGQSSHRAQPASETRFEDEQSFLTDDPAPTSVSKSRPIDEDLLDHLLGEITATFQVADDGPTTAPHPQARSVWQPTEPASSVTEDVSNESTGVPFHNHSAVDVLDAESDAVVKNRVTKPTEVDSPFRARASSSESQTNRKQVDSPHVEETFPLALDHSHFVKELQWEPIPTATGLIDSRQLKSCRIVGIYRDSDAAEETQYTENAPPTQGVETDDTEVEPNQLEVTQSPNSELSIVFDDGDDTADAEGNATALVSEIANYNRSSVGTIPQETIRPMRAEPNRSINGDFESQYVQLVDALCERTPALSSPILMFGAADDLPSAGRCVQHIAIELASRPNSRRVLLVDGRTRSRTLSQALATENAPGLAEVLLEDVDWSQYLLATTTEKLDFLPAGNGLLSICQPIEDKLKQLSVDWKAAYDYVLIDGGDPNDVIPRLWCSLCDATYLLVTLGATETVAAKAAVTEMRAYGARLLGCVVCAQTDVR